MKRYCLILLLLMLCLLGKAQRHGQECENACHHVHGIDVSRHQGDIQWAMVATTNTAYCYIKATEGGSWVDPQYERNLLACRSHGIKVGSYHFYRPAVDQQKQIDNFLVQCNPAMQDLIPMIDIESVPKGMKTEEFQDSLRKFLKLFRKVYRVKPLIYSGRNFYNKYLQKQVKRYPLMIAQYSREEPEVADRHKILMWQYTGSGNLRGVKGQVDKSRFLKKYKLKKIRMK